MRRGNKIWSWFILIVGILYFFLPLVATFIFSLKAKLGVLSFQAYANIFNDPSFVYNFSYSVLWAVFTIIVGILLFVPTAFLIRLKVPQLRGAVEFITLLPFVVPAIVFVFGLVRTFSQPPLLIVNSPALLVAGYTILSMPYMYRAVDTGLRSIDVKTLTEAGQSLGAGWGSILFDIILPNIRVAILSGAFLSFAIVIGELILAQYLPNQPLPLIWHIKSSKRLMNLPQWLLSVLHLLGEPWESYRWSAAAVGRHRLVADTKTLESDIL
jgi:putative spermidine/putrescine transport system permease protein